MESNDITLSISIAGCGLTNNIYMAHIGLGRTHDSGAAIVLAEHQITVDCEIKQDYMIFI